MLPQELREIGPDSTIIMSDNCKPIFGTKIKYYSDPAFKDRLLPPIQVAALDLDTFTAKIDNRVREVQPGEQVSTSKLALNLNTMPTVTNTSEPIAKEVSAMADWLFSNVQWTQEAHKNIVPEPNIETPKHQEMEKMQ